MILLLFAVLPILSMEQFKINYDDIVNASVYYPENSGSANWYNQLVQEEIESFKRAITCKTQDNISASHIDFQSLGTEVNYTPMIEKNYFDDKEKEEIVDAEFFKRNNFTCIEVEKFECPKCAFWNIQKSASSINRHIKSCKKFDEIYVLRNKIKKGEKWWLPANWYRGYWMLFLAEFTEMSAERKQYAQKYNSAYDTARYEVLKSQILEKFDITISK